MGLSTQDMVAIGAMLIGAVMMAGSPVGSTGRATVVRTDQYAKMVRKKAKKDKQLQRLIDSAEESIADDPDRGEPKRVFPNDTLANRMARELGVTTIYGWKVMRQRYQIIYAWDQATNTVTLMAFGNHKDLYRGATPYNP
jgi:mRNA-degrading endonuclease RelE of RelBE toxin-antitoxin system